MQFVLYSSYAVMRGGKCIGRLDSAPKDKAQAWAEEDFGPGCYLRHDPDELARPGMSESQIAAESKRSRK